MNQTLEIAKRELKTMFLSPVGWVVLVIFTLQAGSRLSAALQIRSFRVWNVSEDLLSLTYNFLFTGGNSLISGMAGQLYLLVPLITMGLLSREFADGTIKLILSSPVKVRDIIFGKYFAVCVYGFVMTSILGIFSLILGVFVIDHIDVGQVLWGLFLFYLMYCTYAAIGLFMSGLTSYPFVAALSTIGVLIMFSYSSTLSVDGMPQGIVDLLMWLRGINFIYIYKGFVGLWDVLYYVLIVVMFMGFTWVRLHSLSTVQPWWKLTTKYVTITLIILSIGHATIQPSMRLYTDTRRAELLDTRILVTRDDISRYRTILMQIIPGTMILLSTLLIYRRRKK